MRFFIILIIICTDLVGNKALGLEQSLEEQEIIDIENLYKKNPLPVLLPKPEKAALVPSSTILQQEPIKDNSEEKNSKVKSLTDLNKLAPFSDVSVIQKKFLPKTKRFQLYTAGGLITNSPWFINLGAKINLGYYFSESFGIESSMMLLSNSENEAAKEIRSNNNLQPDKFIITKYNILLDLIWSPIYGKVSNLEGRIIPFDMYFAFGAGVSNTTAQEKTVPTFHIGTGQIYALTKTMAFRWDYSWNFYQATPVADTISTVLPTKGDYSDLLFTVGVSFFFPEAGYR